jgi:hypothetical protein
VLEDLKIECSAAAGADAEGAGTRGLYSGGPDPLAEAERRWQER